MCFFQTPPRIRRPSLVCLAAVGLFLAAEFSADAAVVRAEVTERSDLGNNGYEQIAGRLYFEIDPAQPGNAVIADVGLAPVNAAGRVSFSSDFRILKPKDSARSNGAAWVEIPNRGGKAGLASWITKNGFTVLNVGWESDLSKEGDKLRLDAPAARNKDGSAIRGVVSAIFTPDKRSDEQTLSDLECYPPVNASGPETRLIARDRMAYPAGREVSRELWSLAGNHLHMKGGFEAGRTYEVSYLAEAPPVAGLGYAAIRDAVAWLKHAPDSPAPVKYAYAFGSSQCGRLLRDYLYLGFNQDEEDRPTLDGVIAHIAGAGRLVLNRRWSTPRDLAMYNTASFPFADTAKVDLVSGQVDGLLENARVKGPPRIFYINTDTEYWGGGRVAALTHTDPNCLRDIEFAANVRSYFLAGTQHGPASFPPTAQAEGSPRGNPVDAGAVTTALRLALHHWIAEGVEPPQSVYPKLADGTLTPVAEVRFPKVPTLPSPKDIRAGPRAPNSLWPNAPGAGAELPLLVPQVDADGNDLAGIHMPDVAVPLGTATGWAFRPESMGAPNELVPLRGAWVPFAATKAQREATQDPRLSIEERYASKEGYLAKVQEVLQKLVAQRFLTEDDVAPQMKRSAEHWDWVTKAPAP